MKVLAIKGVEECGNLWAVRCTRLTKRGVRQDYLFLYETVEEAKQKCDELLDILKHHDGVYIGSKEKRKRKVKTR